MQKKTNLAYEKPFSTVRPTIIPEHSTEPSSFVPMLNGTATNQLTSINTSTTPPIVDTITGNATIDRGSLKVFIDNYSELTGLRTSTLKLLDTCTVFLSQQNSYRGNNDNINPTVSIPLDRYMELCGIPATKPSKDKTRRKVKDDLETLYHISMEWTEPSGKKIKDFAKMRICDKVALIRSTIILSFSQDMAKYLTNSYLMQYSTELLKLDERNSNLYPLGRKLLLHHSIDNNKRKGTSNLISVMALLEVCPDIPTYKEVIKKSRQLDQRIKSPLEKSLNALPFIHWEYANSKGAPLTNEQLLATDYQTFEKLFIKFDVLNMPENHAQLDAQDQAQDKSL